MKITEHRTKELLHWHDDMAADHTVLFEAMTAHRDTAALIRQLQAEVQDAWQAGLDAGREQVRGDHAHPSPSVPVGVEELAREAVAQGEAIRARRQQIAGWLEGLGQAARSLRTIADQAGKVEGMEDMEDVRGYANSRATVAEAALTAQPGGSDNDQ